jgi:hypothetical protein
MDETTITVGIATFENRLQAETTLFCFSPKPIRSRVENEYG